MIFRHECKKCDFKSEDAEKLSVCPLCASNTITNDVPVDKFEDDDFCVDDEEPTDAPFRF